MAFSENGHVGMRGVNKPDINPTLEGSVTKFCDNPLPRSLAHTYTAVHRGHSQIQRPTIAIFEPKRSHTVHHYQLIGIYALWMLDVCASFIDTEHEPN